MSDAPLEPNYRYLIDFCLRTRRSADAPILDYGCGAGQVVARGRQEGLQIFGCDTYDTHWDFFRAQLPEGARPYVEEIRDGRTSFADDTFDVVVANQVFEHVPDDRLDATLAEIRRVLRPGGTFLALFPTTDVWFEGHLGLYLVHRIRWRPARRLYLQAAHFLGFGYHRGDAPRQEWVRYMDHQFGTSIFHHDRARIDRAWQATFGTRPHSLAPNYMRFRIRQSRMHGLFSRLEHRLWDGPLEAVCHRRAGRVLATTKEPAIRRGGA